MHILMLYFVALIKKAVFTCFVYINYYYYYYYYYNYYYHSII